MPVQVVQGTAAPRRSVVMPTIAPTENIGATMMNNFLARRGKDAEELFWLRMKGADPYEAAKILADLAKEDAKLAAEIRASEGAHLEFLSDLNKARVDLRGQDVDLAARLAAANATVEAAEVGRDAEAMRREALNDKDREVLSGVSTLVDNAVRAARAGDPSLAAAQMAEARSVAARAIAVNPRTDGEMTALSREINRINDLALTTIRNSPEISEAGKTGLIARMPNSGVVRETVVRERGVGGKAPPYPDLIEGGSAGASFSRAGGGGAGAAGPSGGGLGVFDGYGAAIEANPDLVSSRDLLRGLMDEVRATQASAGARYGNVGDPVYTAAPRLRGFAGSGPPRPTVPANRPAAAPANRPAPTSRPAPPPAPAPEKKPSAVDTVNELMARAGAKPPATSQPPATEAAASPSPAATPAGSPPPRAPRPAAPRPAKAEPPMSADKMQQNANGIAAFGANMALEAALAGTSPEEVRRRAEAAAAAQRKRQEAARAGR